MNTTHPSKSWRKPSAMDGPQNCTVTPMKPMRKLFMRMVMGMVDKNSIERFHNAAL